MKPAGWRRLYDALISALWVLALVGLPITSFPHLVNLTGYNLVAPFAALPLAAIVLLWLLPWLLRRGSLPKETVPLLAFLLAAVAASAAAFFLAPDVFKGRDLFDTELRAFITLAIGLVVYLAFSGWGARMEKLRILVQGVTLGGLVLVIWTLVQSYFILFQDANYHRIFLIIREAISYQSLASVTARRATGLAYEASWLGHMLVVLYLPLWLGASYKRVSAFKFRLLGLSLENILLLPTLFIFYMTSPRIALMALMLVLVVLFVRLNLKLLRVAGGWVEQHWLASARPAARKVARPAVGVLLALAFVGVYLAGVWGVVQFGSQRDPRLARLVDNPITAAEVRGLLTLNEDTYYKVSHRLMFMERVVYWFTGWHIFNDHPLTGVGLGNAGFFYPSAMPARGWWTYEIRDVFYRLPGLPNLKNMWVRVLAETGLVGFALFATWYVLLWRSARVSERRADPLLQLVGMAGQLALVAFLVEGFSIDSFAMPYLWVAAGLISAAGAAGRRQAAEQGGQHG